MTDISFETALEVRDACLCMYAQRAARTLARRFDVVFRPLGLTNGQFSLLMSLNRPKAAAMGAVAEFLTMDRTTLTAALKPLLRRKLIRITADPKDGRARLIELTASGKKLLSRALPVWRAHHAALEKELGRPARTLRDALRRLSDGR